MNVIGKLWKIFDWNEEVSCLIRNSGLVAWWGNETRWQGLINKGGFTTITVC